MKIKHKNKQINNIQEYYYTNDIDIASLLVCKGYNLINITYITQTKVTFIFLKNQEIEPIVESFWTNLAEVKALDFTNTRKNLKSRIYGSNNNY